MKRSITRNRDHACKRILMRFSRCFLFVLAAVFIPQAESLARPVKITLIHTTDLHGHIWPTVDYDGNDNLGGFLRVATEIESIRAENENVLLVDCGDSYQGAPESFLSEGRLIIDGFNTLNYDAWVLGNHEFDWGPKILRARHDQVEVPFLAANIYFMNEKANWLPKVQPFVIRQVNGVKVAIIGLVTPGIPRWSRPHLLDNALFKHSVEALEEIWPDVMEEKPDVIIVATHQGYKKQGDDFANEIQAIARAFPEIDMIVGGHSHQPVDEMLYGDVLFSQAGYHGIWVGRVDFTFDTVEGRVTEKHASLKRMDHSVPYHQGFLDAWRKTLEEASVQLTNVVGHLEEPLLTEPDEKGRSSMQQFICRAIAGGVETDFVLHGSLSEDEIPAGDITYGDVWKIVPYENTIGTILLTPAQIRAVLEDNYVSELRHYSMGPYGFDFDFNIVFGVKEMTNMRDAEGNPLHARKKYKVAFNSYVLASGGERYMTTRHFADMPESELELLPVDTRTLVVDYLKAGKKEAEPAQAHAE